MGIYKGSSIYKQQGNGGGGSVITDETLNGNGTAENPLGVDPQKLNFEGEGGTTSERKAPVKSTITNEQTNRAGFETNGSVFAGSYNSTVSQTFAARRKVGNDGVAARFQVYSDGLATFQQIKNVKGTDQEQARLQFGEGTNGVNWGTMTIGNETRDLAYEKKMHVYDKVLSADVPTPIFINEPDRFFLLLVDDNLQLIYTNIGVKDRVIERGFLPNSRGWWLLGPGQSVSSLQPGLTADTMVDYMAYNSDGSKYLDYKICARRTSETSAVVYAVY